MFGASPQPCAVMQCAAVCSSCHTAALSYVAYMDQQASPLHQSLLLVTRADMHAQCRALHMQANMPRSRCHPTYSSNGAGNFKAVPSPNAGADASDMQLWRQAGHAAMMLVFFLCRGACKLQKLLNHCKQVSCHQPCIMRVTFVRFHLRKMSKSLQASNES